MTDFLLMVGGALFAMFISGIINYGKSKWIGLTDEEVGTLTVFDGLHHVEVPVLANFVRAVEAKLKEKNT